MARRASALVAAALLLAASPSPGQDTCRLCLGDSTTAPGERPLSIEIWADLNFSKLALTGQDGGSVAVDPATGAKRTRGGLVDLGGMTITGRGRISGMPYREVRIELPQRVAMTTPDGGSGELTGFATDLPDHPVLDGNGNLEFSFGAQLLVKSGRGGNFRGRIPISVDYN